MSVAQPFMKFYPQDWRADEKLRLCSLSARGLWLEMLALMHRSERYGLLLISGRVPTDAQLAVQVGAPPHEVSALLEELESAGVFSRAASGAIYSRRMKRDEKKAKIARINGKSGGNPTLTKQKENRASDNRQLNLLDKGGLKPQRPETRDQKGSEDKSSGDKPPDPVKELFDLGVSLLTAAGQTDAKARGLVGKWRKEHGDAATSEALLSARDKTEPVAWIEARLRSASEQTNEFYRAIELKYAQPASAEPA